MFFRVVFLWAIAGYRHLGGAGKREHAIGRKADRPIDRATVTLPVSPGRPPRSGLSLLVVGPEIFFSSSPGYNIFPKR